MAYILYTGEMVAALESAHHPRAAIYRKQYQALNRMIAEDLGVAADVTVRPDDYMEHGRFAAAFSPKTPDQPLPKILEGWDDEGDWD